MTQWGLDTLFNPAKRHMDDEKRRLQSTRAEVGDNSGGKRIDLESGKVVITKPEDADDDAAGADAEPGDKPGDKPGEETSTATKPNRKDAAAPTPAQIRAAKRRGRSI